LSGDNNTTDTEVENMKMTNFVKAQKNMGKIEKKFGIQMKEEPPQVKLEV